MSDAITISKATRDDLEQMAVLFDQYRQFYEEQADLDLANNYLKERMDTDTSVIFWLKIHRARHWVLPSFIQHFAVLRLNLSGYSMIFLCTVQCATKVLAEH